MEDLGHIYTHTHQTESRSIRGGWLVWPILPYSSARSTETAVNMSLSALGSRGRLRMRQTSRTDSKRSAEKKCRTNKEDNSTNSSNIAAKDPIAFNKKKAQLEH